jgi:hypothetical protein
LQSDCGISSFTDFYSFQPKKVLVLQNDEKGINIICFGVVVGIGDCSNQRFLHKRMAVRNKLCLPVFVHRHESNIRQKSFDYGAGPFVQD